MNTVTQQDHLHFQTRLPNAKAVLVLGIITIVACLCYGIGIIPGVIALVLARKDLRLYKIDPASYTASSYSDLKAGKICAIIGIILAAVFLLFIIVLVVLIVSGAWGDPQTWLHPASTKNLHPIR